jgi:ribonuclease M5
MKAKLQIPQAVIVEGRYDRAVLESVIDAVIIPVNGFGVYKDKAKLALIRRYAETTGVILLTDSDNAGRQIRNYLKDCLQGCEVEHIYVPNLLEVEDTNAGVLREVFIKANVVCDALGTPPYKADNRRAEGVAPCDRQRLFDDGLIGSADSAKKRKELLKQMNLPENLSVTALLDVLNKCGSEDYDKFVGGDAALKARPAKEV